MGKYRKYAPEEKIQIVKEYLSGKVSFREIGKRLGYTSSRGYPGSFDSWLTFCTGNMVKKHSIVKAETTPIRKNLKQWWLKNL